MPRLTKLDDVLFPVDEYPVFVRFEDEFGEQRLQVPNKKAIVNRNNRRVLGIVSRSYRMVTNREALDWGMRCCHTVFPETKPGEWEVQATDAPSTGGHCYIDLVHNSTALDFAFVPAHERPEAFGPFIRITNSYNGLRALSFDIGFFRKICKNGMILPDLIIRFKFPHSRCEIGKTIEFEIESKRLVRLRSNFTEYLGVLRDCKVPRGDFEPLVCAVFHCQRPEPFEPNTREADDWIALAAHLSELNDRYANEVGENAYAVLNAITEFASHPPANLRVRRDRHSLQRLAGSWLNTFSKECRKPDFSLDGYLAEIAEAKTTLRAAHGGGMRGHS